MTDRKDSDLLTEVKGGSTPLEDEIMRNAELLDLNNTRRLFKYLLTLNLKLVECADGSRLNLSAVGSDTLDKILKFVDALLYTQHCMAIGI